MILNRFDEALLENIIYVEKARSTNSYAKQFFMNNEYNYKIIVTDNQIDGRGTRDRTWLSIPFKNATFSISIKANNNLLMLDNLSILIAKTISNYLNDRFKIATYIKGLNDIYCNEKKLCGILIETLISESKLKHLLIGIGLNINQETFDGKLNDIATSLKNEIGKEIEIEKLINDICCIIIKMKEIRVFIDE